MLFAKEQVKIKRSLTKKPYAIARFKIGKNVYPRIIRLDKDVIKVKGGMYFVDKGSVYFEHNDKKLSKIGNIEEFVDYEEGVPTINFDVNDILPLRFEKEETKSGSRNPFAIEAIIAKEIAAAEAEMMRKNKSKLAKMMIVNIILTGILVAGIWFIFSQVQGINGSVDQIRALLAAMATNGVGA